VAIAVKAVANIVLLVSKNNGLFLVGKETYTSNSTQLPKQNSNSANA
jgi:hypothetical protein